MQAVNVFEVPLTYDDDDPEPDRSGFNRLGPQLGATRLGATVYEIPPGQALCPYPYESEEEWLLVLEGELTLRHPEGEDVLRRGALTMFPVGPGGAHKTTNDGTETVRLLMWANVDPAGFVVYPGSEKLALWSPEGRMRRRLGDEVEYYDGET